MAPASRQLLAQPVHIDFHRIGADILGRPEEMVLDQPLGHHPARPADQDLQQRQFACAEGLRLAIDKGLPCAGVEGQIARLQQIAQKFARPAQQGADARDQFLEGERLYQIVVGAAAEARDFLFRRAAGGEHQHRGGVALCPQAADQIAAVAIRQAQIHDHGAIAAGLDGVFGLGNARGAVAVETGRLQAPAYEFGKLVIILNHQQTHGLGQPFGAVSFL